MKKYVIKNDDGFYLVANVDVAEWSSDKQDAKIYYDIKDVAQCDCDDINADDDCGAKVEEL
jgi:hypothetical protein